MRRALLGVAVLIGVAACGSTQSTVARTYTVSALVEIQPDRSIDACYPMVPLTMPQTRCDWFTVPVTSVDPSTLPHAQTLPDGVVWTPYLKLIGTWTGSSLSLTEKPIVADAATPPPLPGAGSSGRPKTMPDSVKQNQDRLVTDTNQLKSKGIWIIQSGWSYLGFYVVVAVADDTSVEYIKSRYSADVVAGWLKPA